jgi:uncharacterized protein (TIGR03437 family)
MFTARFALRARAAVRPWLGYGLCAVISLAPTASLWAGSLAGRAAAPGAGGPPRVELAEPAQASSGERREDLTRSALRQIGALAAEKEARTPIQRKIDSQLLAAQKIKRGLLVADSVPAIEANVQLDPQDKVLVDLDAAVSEEVLQRLEVAGGEIIKSIAEEQALRVRLPLLQLEEVASWSEVTAIRRAAQARTHRRLPADRANPSSPRAPQSPLAQRAGQVRARLSGALAGFAKTGTYPRPVPRASATAVAAQGDAAHNAVLARTTFGVRGDGINIGVLSDSYNNLGGAAADVANGHLPGPGNPFGHTAPVTVLEELADGGSDEGRAMLQIVHALAPGARLYYATAFNGVANFARNIRRLREAGCDIIIDDVGYSNESPFQDGPIARAVNEVTAAGVLYFSSAGNEGNLNDGTSGVWEGDFTDSGADLLVDGKAQGRIHRFGTANFNTVADGGSMRQVNLFWSDPLGRASNDYDVYVLNAAGDTVLRFSNDTQNGAQDPYEHIDTLNPGERIVVVKYRGAARFLHLDVGRGRLSVATSGQTRGHSAAVNAFSVAAVDANTAYPRAFVGGAANPVETFSADGPRRVFYRADGTPITAGNYLATGGEVRQKPDIAAADGVTTTLPAHTGLNPFYGTSAAAPHAGAIAALLKSYRPSLTPANIRAALTGSALDIEAPGPDRDSGYGIVMALSALRFVTGESPSPQPPRLEVQPATLDFGSVVMGTVAERELTVRNVGGGALQVPRLTSSHSQFTYLPAAPFTLNPQEQRSLKVSFKPLSAGAQAGTLTMESNDPAQSALAVSLLGTGRQDPAPGPADLLAIDDDSFEGRVGLVNGGTAYFVNRLQPGSYPATLARVEIFFREGDGVGAGDGVTILVGANPDGNADINGTAFQTLAASVKALGQFNVYEVPPLTIHAGDFVVGFQITHAASARPGAMDWTPPSRRRSYVSLDGRSFDLIDEVNPSFAGQLGIRARLAGTAAVGPLVSVSAASYERGAVAQESIVAAFGSRLALQTVAAAVDADPSTPGFQLPTALAGTTVQVRDSLGLERLAPLFYVSAEQINYQVPPGTATGLATVTVMSGDGYISRGTVQVEPVAPGCFTFDGSLAAAYIVRVKAGGLQLNEPIAGLDPLGRLAPIPIDLGPETDQVVLVMFGTGIRLRSGPAAVSARVGGVAAPVLYAGPQPNYVGLDQVNLLLPRSLGGRGLVEIELTVDGRPANKVKVAIR